MEPFIGRDPIKHVIENGMLRDIEMAFKNQAYRAAMILVYCGIDSMSSLYMSPEKISATRHDFKVWVERYYKPVIDKILTWEEVYSARNGLVHAYTSDSNYTREGKARTVNYFAGHPAKYAYDPSIGPSLIMVSYEYLINSFFDAVYIFLSEIQTLTTPIEKINERLSTFMIIVPGDENEAAKL